MIFFNYYSYDFKVSNIKFSILKNLLFDKNGKKENKEKDKFKDKNFIGKKLDKKDKKK